MGEIELLELAERVERIAKEPDVARFLTMKASMTRYDLRCIVAALRARASITRTTGDGDGNG